MVSAGTRATVTVDGTSARTWPSLSFGPEGVAVTQTHGEPAADGDAGGPARPAAPTVLLVDDDQDIRHLIRLYLERMGECEVVGEAVDGLDGIEHAERLQPDVILLDIMMPRLSGHEAIPELGRVAPRSMIVMLSALAAGMHEEPALAAGAFAYIEKSKVDADLGDQLRDLLARFRRALEGETVWAPEHPPR